MKRTCEEVNCRFTVSIRTTVHMDDLQVTVEVLITKLFKKGKLAVLLRISKQILMQSKLCNYNYEIIRLGRNSSSNKVPKGLTQPSGFQ